MKRLAILSLLATGVVAAQAQMPPPGPGFIDRARVQNVQPQYENVQTPRQECGSQIITEQRPVGGGNGNGYGGAIVGGLAGGLLGNQVGQGHGREAATAAGAVIGALTGDRLSNNNQPQQIEQTQREVRTCRTVNDVQSRITGYRVTYEYHGQQYQTVLREQPGQTLPVRVTVTPAPEEREYYRR
jgi:uncharacterized protein YcfJ